MSSANIDGSYSPEITFSHSRAAEASGQRYSRIWSSLKEVCDLLRINSPISRYTDAPIFQHMKFKTGQRVHTLGQGFESLYVVNSGFIKSVLIDVSGNEQVLNFPMKGDLLGIDGLCTRQYVSEAVALTDCDVILVPFKELIALGRANAVLENMVYDVISRELSRQQVMVSMLGGLSADARVACFLVALAGRYAGMGYSSKEFTMRMTRQDIGSYLGLTLETVSRTLSDFKEAGLIMVDQRFIHIKNASALNSMRYLSPRMRGRRKPTATPVKKPAVSAVEYCR